MRPKRGPKQPQREMFQIDLEQLLDMNHPLVRLGQPLVWDSFEVTLGGSYHPTYGAPGISTRLTYLARIGDTIHVLHCFEKNSKKTGRRDLEAAKTRLKEIRQRLLETK